MSHSYGTIMIVDSLAPALILVDKSVRKSLQGEDSPVTRKNQQDLEAIVIQFSQVFGPKVIKRQVLNSVVYAVASGPNDDLDHFRSSLSVRIKALVEKFRLFEKENPSSVLIPCLAKHLPKLTVNLVDYLYSVLGLTEWEECLTDIQLWKLLAGSDKEDFLSKAVGSVRYCISLVDSLGSRDSESLLDLLGLVIENRNTFITTQDFEEDWKKFVGRLWDTRAECDNSALSSTVEECVKVWLPPGRATVATMSLDPDANGQVMTFDPGAVDFVLEMGPSTCNSVEECRATLSTVGASKLTPAAVARIMIGMLKAHEANPSQSSSSTGSSSLWGDADNSKATWNGKVFVQALLEVAPNLKWVDVFPELDFPGFAVKEGRFFRCLMDTLKFGLQFQKTSRPEQFPIDSFYRRWSNSEGQLALIRCCLNASNVELFSFADYPTPSVQTEMLKSSGDKSYDSKEIQAWKSIQLLELLSWLSDTSQFAYGKVLELFQYPLHHCPDILILGLTQLGSPINMLRQELLQMLFPIFLNNHVNSAVILHQAWHSGSASIRPIMTHSMAEWYLRGGDYDQTKLSRILDIAQDLKALPILLNASAHIFIIDLACLASRREFLKLDKWLSDKIRDHGEVFVLSLIKVLNRRVPFIMGKGDENSIPKTAQLPAETVNAMIQCLHGCVGKVSPEVSESILSMVTTYTVLLKHASARQQQPAAQPPSASSLRVGHRTPLDSVLGSGSTGTGGAQNSESSLLASLSQRLNLGNNGGVPNVGNLGTGPGSPSRLSSMSGSSMYPMLAGLGSGGGSLNQSSMPLQSSSSSTTGGISGLGGMSSLLNSRMSSAGLGSNTSSGLGLPSSGEKRTSSITDPSMFSEIQPGEISKEAEDEANSYFHRIYSKPPDPTMSIDDVLDLLKRFQESSIKREREVFQCMLRNLFDEYKFFPQYPDKELHTTAQLFGGIIEHGLVSTYLQLGVALRFVVDALKKAPGSKMYFFGLAALDRFKSRLKEYPQYCQHLSTIPHFQQFPDHLIEYIEHGVRSQEPSRTRPGVASTPALPAASTTSISTLGSATPAAKPIGPASKVTTGGITGRPSIATSTNITTLLAATEKDDKIVNPPENVQDKTSFIFNNLNQMNLTQKCEELKDIIGSDHWPWVAQYLVMKRASIELNFHTLYSNLLDTLRVKDLNMAVLKETHRNIKTLLKTDKSAGNFADRQLLKNLGHWLGLITIMRNKPILLDDLDIKSLIIEAFRKGVQDLLYVVPFAAKIMESCARSLVFKPPCPWTMAILNVLAELHREPDMKLNLKFEIEVLCKALTIEVTDLKPKGLLKDETAFKIHMPQLSYPQALPAGERLTERPAVTTQSRPDNIQSMLSSLSLDNQKPRTISPAVHLEEAAPSSSIQIGSTLGAPQQHMMSTTPTLPMSAHDPKFSYIDVDPTNLSNHLAHIVINSGIPLLQNRPALKTYIRPAVEKAIQDLLGPVVDRSIKYTINACEHIIKKDFALDHEEGRMRNGAHHMMRYITAGMAMITSREHIFIAISTNLKQAFTTALRDLPMSPQMKETIDQAATAIAADNVELASVFIQKTAVEQALVDIDKRLQQEYEQRKLAKQEGRRYYDSVMMSYQNDRIPEAIRVKQSPQGAPLAQQLAVYEDFTRNIPGFLPPTDGELALARKASLAGIGGIVPGVGSSQLHGDELLSIYEKLLSEIQNYFEGLTMSTSQNAPQLASGIRSLMEGIMSARSTRSVVGAIALLSKAVEGLLEGLAAFPSDPEIIRFRDAHLMVLKALQDTRAFGQAWVNRQVTKTLLEVRPELKYNIEAVDTLIRAGLVQMAQFDNHLAMSMDKGTNLLAVAFAMQLVQMYLVDEKYSNIVTDNDLSNTVHMLMQCSGTGGRSGSQPEGLLHLIELLRNAPNTQEGFLGERLQQQQQQQQQQQHQTNTSALALAPSTLSHPQRDFDDPQGLVERSEILLREWVRLFLNQGTPKDSTRAFQTFLGDLGQSGILRSDDMIGRFLRICVQCCVNQVYQGLQAGPVSLVRSKCYQSIDALVRLVSLLIRHIGDSREVKVNLFNKFLGMVAGLLLQEHEHAQSEFQQLPFHRLFIMLFYDLNVTDPVMESISMQILTGFSNTLHILRPCTVPGFAYAWLEIVGNRAFISRMLAMAADPKCWAMYCQLILDLFRFLFPFLRNAELAKPVATLYKGTLRVLLVILHDFPDFLCDYCYHFLDAIPPNCIQMRNLVLSAFPRNMRLPDPFTANLKFEMLGDTAVPPRIGTNVGAMIQPEKFKKDLDSYLKARAPVTFLTELRTNLQVTNEPGTRYNIPLMNALVLYVGSQHIQAIRGRNQTPNMATVAHTSHMDIFQNLAVDLDTEGRYLFLNALANQLRFPSSHTHYFSLVILYLFAQSNTEDVQEQITRVLLERLVVNRPHPWGLLVTFIELIKNPAYKFWQHEFVHCAPEVEKLFESVARSCMVTKSTPPVPTQPALPSTAGNVVDANGGILSLENTME